ncbi:cytochrome c oxidase subunit III (mitochondrion) [Galendromus occidentalis]|uniref:Cytochrome c oxidase subunit 3 n=1 Tax=Galendromus occidentalis TaxID=34638 RepID=A3RE57_9ACAR|nr:cytochrome c oxidase subunit III [Galendromus occidentalis]YP_001096010.1 cytochrome c oxidase subunit III [Galendromus occidentalis]ABN45834.1 cytochrome oxidase subunit 3 [Galendromus occidentalis]ABN45845.1 cytochrome oxidase subunit 3 [Galendromus occidentalis]
MSNYYNNKTFLKKWKHMFHIVDLSPWPLITSLSLMNLMTQSIILMKNSTSSNMKMIFILLALLIICMFNWWRDICREGSFQGCHTQKVVTGLKFSMLLFILSEIMFFFSFFWGFFHFSLSPEIEIGSTWPPYQIYMFNPYQIPLLNTLILLSSGITVTWCHHSVLNSNYNNSMFSLWLTLTLGVLFSLLQVYEYSEAKFSMNDSVYGSTFFMTTGFHGLHVTIGTLFLFVMLMRLNKMEMNNKHHFGLEAAIWYWHFVDVVWLYLYTFMYWWFFN